MTEDNFATKLLGNYTVGIYVEAEYPEHGVRPIIASGFFVEVNGQLLIATAGHFVKKLVRGVNDGVFKIASMQFLDCLGQSPRDQGGYVVNYDALFCSHGYSERLGIDVGFILLPDLYQQGIRANGIKALVPENFMGPFATDFDKYMLAGIPFQSLEPCGSSLSYEMVVATVIPTDDPPSILERDFNRFYAKLASMGHLNDIEGMSGGPIFAFKRLPSGEANYALVGLQNSWVKTERCIAACPGDEVLPFFDEHIRAAIKDAGDNIA